MGKQDKLKLFWTTLELASWFLVKILSIRAGFVCVSVTAVSDTQAFFSSGFLMLFQIIEVAE